MLLILWIRRFPQRSSISEDLSCKFHEIETFPAAVFQQGALFPNACFRRRAERNFDSWRHYFSMWIHMAVTLRAGPQLLFGRLNFEEPGGLDTMRAGRFEGAVVVNGVRMHYWRAGSGPALVLLHGIVGSARNWDRNIEFLS